MKATMRRILRRLGYELRRVGDPSTDLGRDPFRDMHRLIGAEERPLIFDVGANVGQSIRRFREYFSNPVIHSFEPTPDTFATLRRNTAAIPDLHLNNFALGAEPQTRTLMENVHSDMTSFLDPGRESWGSVKQCRSVEVATLDDYCVRNGIERISILKTDTQGFDLEVFRGARETMRSGRIKLIYTEIIMSELYEGLPRFDELLAFLMDEGFDLVSFYEMHYRNQRVAWTDALLAYRGAGWSGPISRSVAVADKHSSA